MAGADRGADAQPADGLPDPRDSRGPAPDQATPADAVAADLPPAQPSQHLWAFAAGGASRDVARDVAPLPGGGVVATGSFRKQAVFGARQLQDPSKGVFVTKIDSLGNVVWAQGGGSSIFDECYAVATDAQGNTFVAGAVFDGATFGDDVLDVAGPAFDAFVAKLSPAGQWLWARRMGGEAEDRAFGLATDAQGDVYVTGTFRLTASFGAHHQLISAGKSDVFVAKLAGSDGALDWAWHASASHTASGQGLAVDGQGNAYVAGKHTFELRIGSQPVVSRGQTDSFVAKLDPTGKLAWVATAGSPLFDDADGVVVEPGGDLYVAGNFKGQATFGAHQLGALGSDVYVAKLSAARGEWLWANDSGGPSTLVTVDLAVDQRANAYVTGFFSDQATFAGATLQSAGGADVFVARFAPNGTRVNAISAGGPGDDRGFGVAIDNLGAAYVVGRFAGAGHAYGADQLTSAGLEDAFVWKLAAP